MSTVNFYTKDQVDNLISDLTQTIYDGIHPVGYIVMGFQAPGVPSGVTATWTDISSSYENRYFKVSSGASGSFEAEELPNIFGALQYLGMIPGVINGTSMNGVLTYGAFSKPEVRYTISRTAPGCWVDEDNHLIELDFKASNSNATYKDGGAVKPLTTTIKVFERTA